MKCWLLICCPLALAAAAWLPLEADVTASYGPPLFALKMLLLFAALLPVLYGAGALAWVPLRLVARLAGLESAGAGPCTGRDDGSSRHVSGPRAANAASHPAGPAAESRVDGSAAWLAVFSTLLLGVAALGLATFILGLYVAPSLASALGLAGVGCAGLVVARRPRLPGPGLRTWSPLARGLFGVTLVAFAVRGAEALYFQPHGDAYLYHLALAETWIRNGRTGVVLSDIYSGYALTAEHFYLFLKLLVRGNAEQNALAQLTHLVVGYGTYLVALVHLGRRWLTPPERVPLLLGFPNSSFVFFMVLPKNDGFLAAAVMLSLTGVASGAPLPFLAGAAVAMAYKPTAGIAFLALGAAAILYGWRAFGSWRRALRLLVAGAALMVLVWAPFGWRNAQVTGDPFFPLLAEVFRSPYAPSLRHVVTEMTPLSLTPLAFARSLGALLVAEPAYLAALVLVALALGGAASRSRLRALGARRDVRFTAVFTLAAFVALQLGLGEFGRRVETRHFLAVLGPLLVLATAAALASWRGTRYAVAAQLVLAAVSLACSSLDVAARSLAEDLGRNQTAAIQEKKPWLWVNAELDRRIVAAEPPLTSVPRVYSTAENNSYFLAHASLWHDTMTYPAWTWQAANVHGESLLGKLAEACVDYVIAPWPSSLVAALAGRAQAALVFEHGGLTVWRLEVARRSECAPSPAPAS